jgi:signal transduction histidine kinase
MSELGDVARLRLGEQLDLRRSQVDLVTLARARADHYQRISANHTITVIAEASSLVGFWDQDRLERVIDNLLSNAIKYSPQPGTVTIRLTKALPSADGDNQAILTITDGGVGIPPADLPIIFDRFQRGGNVTGRFAGAGIGLAGVRQILIQHGGGIDVQSEEGAGTVVTIRLPLRGHGATV